MVSFFGLKFGADKRKKRAESPPKLTQQWTQAEEYIGRRESYLPLNGASNRPRTSQGTHGSRGLYPGDASSQHTDADFKGIRAVLLGTTAAVPAGTGPVLSPTLKTFSSESNLRVGLGTRNLSSTSLHMPPRRLPGETGSENTGPRPGTAHSMRGGGAAAEAQKPFLPLNLPNASTSAFEASPRSPLDQDSLCSPGTCDSESLSGTVRDSGNRRPHLHLDLPNVSTTTFGGTPKSPLGQYEFTSPVKSDTDSLLGDDPGKIVDEIAARITREEKLARPQVSEDRRELEIELEEQRRKLETAKKNLEAARLRMAYPSPPASIESERDGRKPSLVLQVASYQEGRLTGTGLDTALTPALTPSSSASGTSDGKYCGTDAPRTGSSPLPMIDAPPPSPKAPPPTSTPVEGPRERSNNTDEKLSPDSSQMLRPQQPPRGPNVPGTTTTTTTNPPRSPLFQQMSPFDIHSDEEYDEDEHMVDHRAANAPYGLPSPPLSHHQRPSKDEDQRQEEEDADNREEGRPVLRTVQAKRDTTLVGAAGRTSLGLQIEEFEKSLQQAQAMSALENGPEVRRAAATTTANMHRRADSNASSTYSAYSDDMSDDDDDDAEESPMVIEPPLISPKPFPLSPRPMGPRASTPAAEKTPTGRPTLEVRAESPFGSFFESFTQQQTAGVSKRDQQKEEEEEEEGPATPQAGRPRPRLGAVKPSRPMLGEYGPVKVNTVVATLAGRRVQRPSRDEYDVSVSRGANNNSFNMMDSPTLNYVRQAGRSPGFVEDMTDGLSSANTSRTTSPTAAVASYSVFSPPPPPVKQRTVIQHHHQPQPQQQQQQQPLPRSTKPEWYGPAPTAPPTSPLPNPDKSAVTIPRRIPTTPQPALAPATPGLRTSPSIVPDMTSNPNWPLPNSTSFASPPETGFTARRSLHRDGRAAPPAPINIMATKYADEVDGEGGPWTPTTNVATPRIAAGQGGANGGGGGGGGGDGFEIRSDFSGWKEEPAPHQREVLSSDDGESSAAGIGVARGLSIKYDKIRERERRVRGHDKMKRMAIVTVDEDVAVVVSPGHGPGPVTPTTGEPFDRLRRPNHGLKSPMGFADEQGIRFI